MRTRIGLFGAVGVTVVAAISLWLSGSAGAVHEVVIEFTVVTGPPNSVQQVATEEVEPWLQGETCGIHVEVTNNVSTRTDTDLLIASGNDLVTIPAVEASPGLVTIDEGELVFGESVVVSVRLGEEGRFSSGISVDFVCEVQPPTTTTTTTTTTTAVPTTTAAPTTTAQVAPASTAAPTTTTTTLPEALPASTVAAQPDYTG